jgi:hypothetical protein
LRLASLLHIARISKDLCPALLERLPPPADHGGEDATLPTDLFEHGFSLEAFHYDFELAFRVGLFVPGCPVSGPFLVCFFHCLSFTGYATT